MGEGYSWVPPGLSSAKIEEYMKQLPSEKVPKLGGSHGERYRERQLHLQLPKQDLSSKYCSHLEPLQQVKLFDKLFDLHLCLLLSRSVTMHLSVLAMMLL